MSLNTIDAKVFAKMFLAGAKNLESKKEWINELNVFPVPDGDTGTNMTLTIMSAAKEVAAMKDSCKGYFLRFPPRCEREFWRYPFPAFPRFYQGYPGV